ncbi:MAG: hypothetical protein V5A64_04915 [Candidatus Thermoplasmatota archaeon]
MNETHEKPKGIWVFISAVILLDIIYLYVFFQQNPLETLKQIDYTSIANWINLTLIILSIPIISYGFIKAKNWARNYAKIFLIWSIIWNIYLITTNKQILIHYLFFTIWLILLVYLLMSPVRKYFIGYETVLFGEEPYKIGDYTLYKREIKQKNGKSRTFYYFSKNDAEKGEPCSKPEGYKVEINPKTGVPYLKKSP